MTAPSSSSSSLLWDLRQGTRRCVDVTREALEAARRHSRLNAFARLHEIEALAAADTLDRRAGGGDVPGPLHGLPLAVKDNIDEAGQICAGACRAYESRRRDVDAPAVRRLRRAGAVILGRTNMHELADGVTSEVSTYGPVVNPHRAGYTAGGSSGGSGAAVAAGIVPAALGTDTGGSVRIPAALCGVVGVKPTRGRVPTAGVMPLSTTLDHVGVLADSVALAAEVLAVLMDDGAFPARCRVEPGPLRLGVLEGFGRTPDPGVTDRFQEILDGLVARGHARRTHTVEALGRGIRQLAAIYPVEAAEWHLEALQYHPGHIDKSVRLDLERGLEARAADRRDAALSEVLVLQDALAAAFTESELLLCPTTPHPARPFGSPSPHAYLTYTCPFNLTGHPALSLPMGRVDGLPVGLQIIGPPDADARVLAFAAALEEGLR